MKEINMNVDEIKQMGYVDFMATLDEINRPPGGKKSLKDLAINTFINSGSNVLDVGCNTGYCSFEIAHLVKCRVVGVDINSNMINTAKKFLEVNYPELRKTVNFKLGDGRKLPFDDNTFDLVMNGGSTAFIDDIPAAIQEYARVAKPWSFIGDINFYYLTNPPTQLIEELNRVMGTQIHPWDKKYWLDLYESTGLEIYQTIEGEMEHVTDEKVKQYCQYLATQKSWSPEVTNAAVDKLCTIMNLFNENHKYLGYGVFILRKRTEPEITLF